METKAKLELADGDRAELARILACEEDQLKNKLSTYASAAIEEYATMFLGQKVFKRGSDIREYRLYLLIKHAFNDRIPDESQVCRLFQITATESRSLIRSVMSKYQYQLQSAVKQSVVSALGAASQNGEGEPYQITINNTNIIEALNLSLADIDGTLDQVSKKRGSVSTYEIEPASYEELCNKFNV